MPTRGAVEGAARMVESLELVSLESALLLSVVKAAAAK